MLPPPKTLVLAAGQNDRHWSAGDIEELRASGK
jgi:hypothetical protein